jgi:long-chain acyl-CoA synthetase
MTRRANLRQPNAATAEELKDWVNQRIEARHQRVYPVDIMGDFPRNTADKKLKRVMREKCWADHEKRSKTPLLRGGYPE